jgi:hypothetical protein
MGKIPPIHLTRIETRTPPALGEFSPSQMDRNKKRLFLSPAICSEAGQLGHQIKAQQALETAINRTR